MIERMKGWALVAGVLAPSGCAGTGGDKGGLAHGKSRLSVTTVEQLPALPSSVQFASNPAVATYESGDLNVVIVGSDKNLWLLRMNGGTWGSWQSLGQPGRGGLSGDPAVTAYAWNSAYRLDVAVRDESNGLDHFWYDFSWNGSAWDPLSISNVVSSPAIAAWSSGNFVIFYTLIGSGALHEIHQINAGTWSSGSSDTATTIAGSPAGTSTWNLSTCNGSDACGDAWAAYRSADGTLHDLSMEIDQTSATAPVSYGTDQTFGGAPGDVLDRPSVTSRARGLLDLFDLDAATGSLEHRWYTSSLQSSGVGSFSAQWLGPKIEPLSPGAGGVPAVASPGPGRVDIVYLGTDGNLWHAVQAASAVPTHHVDVARTGAKLDELDLNAGNVSLNAGASNEEFGRLGSYSVDGDIHAQPLYVPQVYTTSDARRHNLLIVATQQNSVFAFDADDPSYGVVWQDINIAPPVPFPNGDFTFVGQASGCWNDGDLDDDKTPAPFQGIMSTAAIDPAGGYVYIVAFTGTTSTGAWLNSCSGVSGACTSTCDGVACGATCTSSNGPNTSDSYNYYIYKLRLTDGSIAAGPVAIEGSVSGSGDAPFVSASYLHTYVPGVGYGSTSVTFSPTHQMQRPALLLDHGILYVAFGSYADSNPYHGWLFAYGASSLSKFGMFCTTPTNVTAGIPDQGSIWQAGGGPAADEAGNVYVEVGNGTFSEGLNYGDSVIKLSYDGSGLSVADSFTPFNQASLNAADIDLGAGGPMVLESSQPHVVIAQGKQGEIYVLQQDHLGGYNSGPGITWDNVLQEFFDAPAVPSGSSNCPCNGGGGGFDFSWAAAWTSQQGTYLYLWPAAGPLYGYQGFGNNCSLGSPFCAQSCPLVTTCSQVGAVENPTGGGGGSGTCASPSFISSITETGGCQQGAWLSLSANEGMPGTGIVWAVTPLDWSGSTSKPTLHAFNALNLSTELWDSEMNGNDSLVGGVAGYLVPHFVTPLVANGHVFVPTTGGGVYGPVVHVYGLKGR